MYRHFFKRLIDIVLSLLAAVVLLLPMLVIGLIVKIDSPGPALFFQKRFGVNRTYFNIINLQMFSSLHFQLDDKRFDFLYFCKIFCLSRQ